MFLLYSHVTVLRTGKIHLTVMAAGLPGVSRRRKAIRLAFENG